jgi:uncharacterized protein YecE (DUF72 family)
VTSFYYARLHGRNAAQWWRHAASEDRYNYLYSEEELRPVVETALSAKALVKKVYLYLNNHFAAQSVANAVAVKHLVRETISGDFPPELVERYPFLKPIVSTAPVTVSRTPSSAGLPLEDEAGPRSR